MENIDPMPAGLQEELDAHGERIAHLLAGTIPPEEMADDLWRRWRFYASDPVRTALESLESAEYFADGIAISELRRIMLANWRARNLAMAARLRSATAAVPGGRVLFVVGSSHEMPLRTAQGTDQYDLRLTALEELEEQ